MCQTQDSIVRGEKELTRGIIILQHSGCSTHFVLQRTNRQETMGSSFANILSDSGSLTLNKAIASILQEAGVNVFSEEMFRLGWVKLQFGHTIVTTKLYVSLLDCGRLQISSVEELTHGNIGGLLIYNIHCMHEEIIHNTDPYFLTMAARLIARKIIYC